MSGGDGDAPAARDPGARERKLVVAALVVRDGRVLLCRRRADQPMPLSWELPGGKVEPGESPAEALARELREELGADAEVGPIYEVVYHRYPAFDLLMPVYRCALRAAPRAVAVDAIAWARPDELAGYDLLPADVALRDRLVREGLPGPGG